MVIRVSVIREVKFHYFNIDICGINCMSQLKNPFQVRRSVLTFHLRTPNKKHQSRTFKMSPFLAIDYSFATKVLHTGQQNYEGMYTCIHESDGPSEQVSEFAIVSDNQCIHFAYSWLKNI